MKNKQYYSLVVLCGFFLILSCKESEQKFVDSSIQSKTLLEGFMSRHEFKNRRIELDRLRKWSDVCLDTESYDTCMISSMKDWIGQQSNLSKEDLYWIENHPENIYMYFGITSILTDPNSNTSTEDITHVLQEWIKQEKRQGKK